MNKAIFLDRDGTLIKDKGYIGQIKEVEFYSYTIDCLKKLQEKYLLFIITNQAGVGKGLITLDEMYEIHRYLLSKLAERQIKIKEIYYCPHAKEDNCRCRKPNPYFLNIAKEKYQLDIQNSYVIGDHPSDVELAINGKANGIYLLTGHGQKHYQEVKNHFPYVKITRNLKSASDHILKQ